MPKSSANHPPSPALKDLILAELNGRKNIRGKTMSRIQDQLLRDLESNIGMRVAEEEYPSDPRLRQEVEDLRAIWEELWQHPDHPLLDVIAELQRHVWPEEWLEDISEEWTDYIREYGFFWDAANVDSYLGGLRDVLIDMVIVDE